jgi:hypothetical protein
LRRRPEPGPPGDGAGLQQVVVDGPTDGCLQRADFPLSDGGPFLVPFLTPFARGWLKGGAGVARGSINEAATQAKAGISSCYLSVCVTGRYWNRTSGLVHVYEARCNSWLYA